MTVMTMMSHEGMTLFLLLLWLPESTRVTCCVMETLQGLADHSPPASDHSRQLTRRGIGDRMLLFTSIIEPPFLQRTPQSDLDADATLGAFQGFIPDLISRVARKMHQPFAIKLVSPGQGGYGVDLGDGGWNGIIGEVARGEADVAAGALTIKQDRQEVVDFSRPFMTAGIAAILKRSPGGVHNTATSPLELADRMDLRFGLIPGSLTYHYFRTSNDTRVKRLWHRITTADPPFYEWSSNAGIQRVRNSSGDYVFLVESVFAEYHVTKPPCNLVVLENLVNLSEYAFAVQQGSDLKARIDKALEYLNQNGVIRKLKDKWWNKACVRRKDKRKNPRTHDVIRTSPVSVPGTESSPHSDRSPGQSAVSPRVTTPSVVTRTLPLADSNSTYSLRVTTVSASFQTTQGSYHSRKGTNSHGGVTRWRPCFNILTYLSSVQFFVFNILLRRVYFV